MKNPPRRMPGRNLFMKKNDDNDLIFGRLIACDPLVGPAGIPGYEYNTDIPDLTNEMQRLNIAQAIVRNHDCLNTAPYFGNDMLLKNIAGNIAILPAWFLTPDGRAPAYNVTELIETMLNCKVQIAWTDPSVNSRYSLQYFFQTWCCKEMLDALQQHLVPLLISFKSINLSDLHNVMADFPKLRIILLDIPRLGRQATLEALLQIHAELYLCFSPSFAVHGGYKDLCSRYGDHRWVWGMGYPESEGGAAITGLVYSGLTKQQIEAVSFRNMERLLAEVKK